MKTGQKIVLWTFIIVICLMWPIWLVAKHFADTTNYENRELATMPSLSLDAYPSFASDFETYFNDYLPFRNYLISLNSAIDYFAFNESSSDNVILGKDKFLFYSDVTDGDPVACYEGTNLFTDDELAQMAANLTNIKNQLSAQGTEFVLFIAPNKERMYSEDMPASYGEPADDYRALQLVQYLKQNTDINVVYPYDELMEAKNSLDENIYYKTDTHWNYIGGYVGTRELLKALDINMPDITSADISIEKGEHISGDLAAQLHMSSILKKDDYEYTVTGYDDHDVQNLSYEFYQVYAYEAENADPRTLYVVRDSFGTYMAPYLGSQFSKTYMRHQNTYTYEDVENTNPDIFVYEVCERKLWRLPSFTLQ